MVATGPVFWRSLRRPDRRRRATLVVFHRAREECAGCDRQIRNCGDQDMSGLSRRRFLRASAAVAALAPISRTAWAEDAYPSRPIRLVVGFTPGTAADITARTFAAGAEGILGQRIVVENRPGAGSALGAEYVARAAKDGYTLFLSTLSIVTAQAMKPDANFDLVRDFAPVSLLASGAVVLVVHPDSGLRSVADLIALAKAKPGEVLCANAGVGSLPHFSGALFAQRAGIKVTHVPYPGSPQAVNDLLGGRVTMFFSPASTVIGQIQAGKLRALATAAGKRASSPPDRPPIGEAGPPPLPPPPWVCPAPPRRPPPP